MPSKLQAQALNLLRQALEAVDQTLKDWSNNPLAHASERELILIRKGLDSMANAIRKNDLNESPRIWRLVTDTWPYTNDLGQLIIRAESAYDRYRMKGTQITGDD